MPRSIPKSSSSSFSRVSLKDIAAEAQVSIGSVSSVLNNRHIERRIPAETARKIRETAARLGYLPNISARRLRSSDGVKNGVVLALVTSFEAPIPLLNHYVTALREEAQSWSDGDHTFSLLIEMFSAGRLREMPGLLTGDHFNAAIIMNTTAEDDLFLTRTHLPYPVVLVNRAIADYSSVIEHPGTGARASEILIESKRLRHAVICGTPLTQISQTRVARFLKRSTELLGCPPREIVAEKLSEDAGYHAVKEYLASTRSPCDGLYAVSDALALGAYRAIREHGLKIPEDIAVVGVGDYEIGPYFDPPLSCVGGSHEQLAREASRLLTRQIFQGSGPSQISIPMLEALRNSIGKK